MVFINNQRLTDNTDYNFLAIFARHELSQSIEKISSARARARAPFADRATFRGR